MLKNYIIIAYRNLLRNRVFALLNILGLAVGIACVIVIYMYVRQESSYDAFYQKSDRTYRLTMDFNIGGKPDSNALVTIPAFDKVTRELPEVEVGTKTRSMGTPFIEQGATKLEVKNVWYADENFFKVFDQRFVQGTATALNNPYSIVLTQSLAKTLFGRTNVVGHKLRINEGKSYQVTGVIADVPYNTHFRYKALVSMASLYNKPDYKNWQRCNSCLRVYGYVAFRANTNQGELQAKVMSAFKESKMVKQGALKKVGLQPLTDIHLTSKLNYEIQANGDVQFVYTFSIIALLIIVIASINYMNLATAKSLNRAKEVGIRKVMGSYRSQLIAQFLVESVIVVYISLGLGVLLSDLLLPLVSQIAPQPLSYRMFDQQFILWFLAGGTLLGILSGLYPALALSGFKPVLVLKGKFARHPQGVAVRKSLVIVQFTISSVLIVSSIVAYQQLRFMQQKDLGFDKEQVLVVSLPTDRLRKKVKPLKQAWLQNSQVKSVAFTSDVPGGENPGGNYTSFVNAKTRDTLDFIIPTTSISYDFIKVMNLKVKAGRNFAIDHPTDTTKAALINEALAKKIGWKNIIGQKVANYGINGKIIGILPDFHHRSLHEKIEPTIYQLQLNDGYHRYAMIKVQPQNMQSTLGFIANTWKKFEPNRTYAGFFLDQNFEKQYRADQQREALFIAFAGLAIMIACLGLFGLAAYTVERRIKEIGIRKVLGASVANILKLISQNFLLLILIANLVAIPLSYWLMSNWLSNFAYHINVSWWVFCVALVMVVFTALATISYQTVKAALANPVKAIRHE